MRRARLIRLEGVEAREELGIVGALLAEPASAEGALVVSRLRGAGTALGRWQPGAPGALRRWTGGRATRYADGIASLCAIAPDPQAWLDGPAGLSGPRLLNRWARGLLAGLGAMGLQAAYPGRDFATANGRQVAGLALERAPGGRALFQAVIGLVRPHPAEPDPSFPGLPPYPPASSVEAEGGSPDAVEALARGVAQRFGLELIGSEAPAPGPLPPDPTPDGVVGAATDVPIGRLRALLALGADGRIARARILGDWIAASADLETLEAALLGLDPGDRDALERIAARWLALPGVLAIGVTEARQIAEALRGALEVRAAR